MIQVTQPSCNFCASGSLRGNGWLQRSSMSRRSSGRRQSSRWSSGGGGFFNSMNRYTNKWSSQGGGRYQNDRYSVMGGGNGGGGAGWNRWGIGGGKLNILKSWFG